MELLNSTMNSSIIISNNPLISLTFPKFPSKITTLRKNTPSKLFILASNKFPLSLSCPSRFRISASFRKPTNRQNYLRKKLWKQKQVSSRILESNPENFGEKSSNLDANFEKSSDLDASFDVKETDMESKSKLLGESVLWNKLEGWVEQYKNDIEFWGIGKGPIFTVFKDSDGKVEKVVIDEDEILRRSGVDPLLYKEGDFEVLTEVNSRISHAKTLAREMESGNEILSGNSSVAKFVVDSSGKSGIGSLIQVKGPINGFTSSVKSFIQEVSLRPAVVSKLSRTAVMVVCGIFVISAVKRLFTPVEDHRKEKEEYTSLEKEMLRRKIKARMDKEKDMKGSIEVVDDIERKIVPIERPQLDKQELLESIISQARKSNGSTLALPESLGNQEALPDDFERRIQEIREMARHARELEKADTSAENSDDENLNQLSKGKELLNEYGVQTEDPGGTKMFTFSAADSKDESTIHIDVASAQNGVPIERPQLDKQGLLKSIISQARKSNGSTLALPESLGNQEALPDDFERRIQEIREMARHARELEKADTSAENSDDENLNQLSKGKELLNEYGVQTEDPGGTKMFTFSAADSKDESRFHINVASAQNGVPETSKTTGVKIPDDAEFPAGEMAEKASALPSFDAVEGTKSSKTTDNYMQESSESSVSKRFKIISSVKEAREYLSKKHDKGEATGEHEARTIQQVDVALTEPSREEAVAGTSLRLDSTDKMFDPLASTSTQNFMHAFEEFPPKIAEDFQSINRKLRTGNEGGEEKVDLGAPRPLETEPSHSLLPGNAVTGIEMNEEQNANCKSSRLSDASDPLSSYVDSILGKQQSGPSKEIHEVSNETEGGVGLEVPAASSGQQSSSVGAGKALSGNQENWIEKNFHEFEPIVKKMAVGFSDNYMVAKEKTNQDISLEQLLSSQDGNELEWMKDERLREIVFKVRDNELAGKDPFHQMDDEEKHAFFSGLEKKVEEENAKLSNLHEWLHSNIENLDYGADGISIYDPPEKIIPRWKGPPVEKIPEFLKSSIKQEKPIAESIRDSDLLKHDDRQFRQSRESLSSDVLPAASFVRKQNPRRPNNSSRSSKTVIEGSDGSTRAGKKSGKEFWQHTKKWSQGFLESYNGETDPEMKGVMKDIGKDLDRWITEKEIKEAADLMDKLPEKGQKIIKEKLEKVKRQMEMFGPRAVVDKYREYADEKEPDYLWWLDLPHILCLELHTEEDGKQDIGFYSLEMAADLELDPKQYHVVAFEDAGDCKNLCYIIQAHMEMLGTGNAFVVARPPKDVFRDAKANEYGVTVIRKGELQLNVDQTLEEVEESIAEIGSKTYHDTIMRERSLDISAVMKGVFGLKKPTKRRRSKKRLKKPTKP